MDPREFRMGALQAAEGRDATEFTISLTLSVADAGALWCAAAGKGLTQPGARIADVLDTIGPREDPSIADCLAMLALPGDLPGCLLDSLDVRAA